MRRPGPRPTSVAVTAGETTAGTDAELAFGATITGTVTGPDETPLEGICVTAADAGFDNAGSTETDAAGAYVIDGLRPASYKLKYFSCGVGNYATEFFDDKPTRATADAIALADGATAAGIDAELAGGGTITGTVTGPGGTALAGVCVTSSDDELDGDLAETDASGRYTLSGLRAGAYRVGFSTCAPSDLVSEFYNDKPTRALANPVTVAEGATTANIDARLAREGKIAGTVRGPGGAPLDGVCVDGYDSGLRERRLGGHRRRRPIHARAPAGPAGTSSSSPPAARAIPPASSTTTARRGRRPIR